MISSPTGGMALNNSKAVWGTEHRHALAALCVFVIEPAARGHAGMLRTGLILGPDAAGLIGVLARAAPHAHAAAKGFGRHRPDQRDRVADGVRSVSSIGMRRPERMPPA